ncbi:MBL fold metallo-hydrolase [Streptacidiphilus cavernicola]|uniref:MBL fold metallo-hydrolase n=1 Tax=Streptacidiphilus cavernicola TaxID=3342716 RepID=A0ABV6VUX2_9ACTN
MTWIEVAERVFQRRYQPCDVTVTAVVGADGLAVADTRCSLAEARELREHLRELSDAPVRWVVNTHVHFDHVWGNAEFVAPRQLPPAELWAHRAAVAAMRDAADDPETAEFKTHLAGRSEEWAAKIAELVEAVPDHEVDREHVLDLGGGRVLELRHLGRGHTGGDLVLRVPDAGAVLVGDLVEQSGPPAFGPDSFPLDWAPTLDAVLAFGGPDAVFVPGHGDAVGASFVREQAARIRSVAEQVTALHAGGVPESEALAAGGGWAFDSGLLEHAVGRAYAQLRGELR